MPTNQILVYTILLLGGIWSFATGKLTLAGSIVGAVTGWVVFIGAGLPGFCMMTFFFVVGSAATKWQRGKKIAMNAADTHHGRRTAWQVVANSGVAGLLGLLAWCRTEYQPMAQLMIAGSFAAAMADTLSSELGTVYGKRFYNIITFKSDMRGLDGVVSLEGTLTGLMGASFIALIYVLYFGWGLLFFAIVLAGFTGNLVDSVLGAVLERKGLMGNNMVNFLNTAVGAGVCYLTSQL